MNARIAPSAPPSRMRKSSKQNSRMTWRHTPQGGQKPEHVPSFPPTTAMAINARSPSLTAFANAVRSAQMVGE